MGEFDPEPITDAERRELVEKAQKLIDEQAKQEQPQPGNSVVEQELKDQMVFLDQLAKKGELEKVAREQRGKDPSVSITRPKTK
jgi:hypothetical protein